MARIIADMIVHPDTRLMIITYHVFVINLMWGIQYFSRCSVRCWRGACGMRVLYNRYISSPQKVIIHTIHHSHQLPCRAVSGNHENCDEILSMQTVAFRNLGEPCSWFCTTTTLDCYSSNPGDRKWEIELQSGFGQFLTMCFRNTLAGFWGSFLWFIETRFRNSLAA